ncbi:MAG: flavin reductase family protein [Planctomycetota bacterium]|jgi:flavin reductase (DIM6/NTAB) family NADH-FMN oxidoreductase RutF
MAKAKIRPSEYYDNVIEIMTSQGLLLGSYDAAGKPNIMTIGWGSVGAIWGMPVWIVLVRPSRYSYACIEHTGCFSVNVPTASMSMACAVAGSRSGRDVDKFAECNLTAEKGKTVLAPVVGECPIIYECQVVHSNDVLPAKLADEILSGAYIDGDFHRLYFGKVLSAEAEPDALELLQQ